MDELRFINRATVEYLKSKAGSTIEQQLIMASNRLNTLEDNQTAVTNSLNYLGNHIKDTRLELLNEIGNLRGHMIEDYDEFLKARTDLKYGTENLEAHVKKLTKFFAGAILAIFVLGVTLCLVLR